MKNNRLIIVCVIVFTIIVLTVSCSTPTQSKYKLNENLYGNSYGKDYRGHVGDGKYQIMHVGYDSLIIMNGKNWGTKVLEYEYGHSFDENEILYYYAADGFAVVNPENNICKVLITPPDRKLVEADGDKEPIISGRKAENNYCITKLDGENYKLIIYLDTFDEYTEYEQKMLNTLVDKHEKSERLKKLFD